MSAAADVVRSTQSESGTRRLGDIRVILALIALLAGAFAGALLLAPSRPGDDSVEAGFARDMSIHHTQAVEMALIARDRTQDEAIRTLATDIMLTQQAQIGQMQGWLDSWGLPLTGREPSMSWMGHPTTGLMPGMATPDEMNQLKQLSGTALDAEFLRLMIHHHQGGVAMAEAAVELSSRPEVRRLAGTMVTSQQNEITVMDQLLQAKGFPIPAPLSSTMDMTDGSMSMQMDMQEHGEGFFSDIPDALHSMLRALPLVAALFAAGWLAFDGARRRYGRRDSEPEALVVPESADWHPVAVVGLLISAIIHAGLTSEHFQERTLYGVVFVAATVLAALLAGALAAWPAAWVSNAAAVLMVGLIAAYVLFRLVPPPGAASPEGVDLLGAITQIAQLTVVAVCLSDWLVRRDEPERQASVA